MRTILTVAAVCFAMVCSTASAQTRYSRGTSYTLANPYGANGSGVGGSQFGYGPQGAWSALSRRHGYDPIYIAQPQPVYYPPQPIYYPPQPTLYLGGTGYQYAPTVYGSPQSIYRGY